MCCCSQVKRATKFLNILFKHAPEPVILVVTHSGFARSVLLAVQREPYRPQNAELIPVIVEQTKKRGSSLHEQDESEEDDSWIDAVLQQHEQHLKLDGDADPNPQQRSPCIIRRFIIWAMQKLHDAGY